MPKTVILGAARTPFGKMGGGARLARRDRLGGTAIAAALERAEVAPDQVEHVVFGQVLQAGQGQIPSRQAQIKGGIPKEVSSETVNKVCASGIRSAGMVDQAIRAGDLDVAVAGGMESMSNAPYLLQQARFGYRMGDAKALDAMMHDGLTNPFTGKHMGEEADEVGEELEITRADMDKFALRSHELAIQATDEGRLPEEIVPVTISSKKGDTTVEIDEAPRRDSSLETLVEAARRVPQGRRAHRRQRAGRERRRRRARARVGRVGEGERPAGAGDDRRPGRGGGRLPLPGPDARERRPRRRSRRRGCRSTTSTCSRSTRRSPRWRSTRCACSGVDESKVNVNGGAIALGHPIGASGARILMTLVNELRRRGGGLGVAAICSGGGQGDAVIVEVNGRASETGRCPVRRPFPGSSLRRMPGAAFFDLDKTLMEGSSALHFGRAAYKRGMMSRRQLARDAWANLKFRLNGLHRRRAPTSCASASSTRSPASGWWTSRASGPTCSPGSCRCSTARCSTRPTRTRTPAAACTSSPPRRRSSPTCWRSVLVLDGGIGMRSEVRDGVYTGRPAGPFTYREGKAEAIRELAAREGHRPRRVVRLLGLGVRPSDDARRRPPGGREPRPRARAGRARGGLADHALRQARRRLRWAGAVGGVLLVGGGSGYVAARARRPSRRRLLPRR